MSIATKLAKLKTIKQDIKSALEEKGQTPSNVFSTYANNIRAIETGGGSGGQVKFIHTLELIGTKLPSSQTQYMGSASVGDNIYLFGGQNNTSSTTRISSILKFNTITEELTTLSTTLPDRTMNIRCCSIGTKIYLFGGQLYSGSVMEKKIYIFDTETETLELKVIK